MKSLDRDYDYIKLLKLSSMTILYKIIQYEPQYTVENFEEIKKVICSDLILFTIMDNSAMFRKFIEKNFTKFDVSKYGSFSVDDCKVTLQF